ncbi:hypothetical protein [Epinotia aporema granulovirus]|uniref:Uncharacterized protein n=1 Tax=Epinotia aporema granulovirus TaxID=166056 RepID=K4EQT3_9BBAC|nr:hypothetical protein [Epinotia aporema granulovirus]AER41486.1 hypothetical protein [Epinotia aporema granulovirus]
MDRVSICFGGRASESPPYKIDRSTLLLVLFIHVNTHKAFQRATKEIASYGDLSQNLREYFVVLRNHCLTNYRRRVFVDVVFRTSARVLFSKDETCAQSIVWWRNLTQKQKLIILCEDYAIGDLERTCPNLVFGNGVAVEMPSAACYKNQQKWLCVTKMLVLLFKIKKGKNIDYYCDPFVYKRLYYKPCDLIQTNYYVDNNCIISVGDDCVICEQIDDGVAKVLSEQCYFRNTRAFPISITNREATENFSSIRFNDEYTYSVPFLYANVMTQALRYGDIYLIYQLMQTGVYKYVSVDITILNPLKTDNMYFMYGVYMLTRECLCLLDNVYISYGSDDTQFRIIKTMCMANHIMTVWYKSLINLARKLYMIEWCIYDGIFSVNNMSTKVFEEIRERHNITPKFIIHNGETVDLELPENICRAIHNFPPNSPIRNHFDGISLTGNCGHKMFTIRDAHKLIDAAIDGYFSDFLIALLRNYGSAQLTDVKYKVSVLRCRPVRPEERMRFCAFVIKMYPYFSKNELTQLPAICRMSGIDENFVQVYYKKRAEKISLWYLKYLYQPDTNMVQKIRDRFNEMNKRNAQYV